jgi:HEAT repeat protein
LKIGERRAAVNNFPPKEKLTMKNTLARASSMLLVLLPLAAFGQDGKEPIYKGRPLNHWLERLQSENFDQRQEAVEAFRALAKEHPAAMKATVPALVAAVKDRVKYRFWALLALQEIGAQAKDAAPAVQDLALDRKEFADARIQAARTLAAIGGDPAPALLKMIQDTEQPPSNRLEAAATLGKVGADTTAAVPILYDMIENQRNLSDRWAAASVLRGLKADAKEATQLLLPLLKKKDRTVLMIALYKLREMGAAAGEAAAPLRGILLDKEAPPRTRVQAVETLLAVGGDASAAAPIVLEIIQKHDRVLPGEENLYDLPAYAIDVLLKLKPDPREAVPILIDVLENPRVRVSAAKALASFGPEAKAALPHLSKAFKDKDLDYRRAAIGAVCEMGQAAVPPLIQALDIDDQSGGNRRGICLALGRMGKDAKEAVPRLIELLSSDNDHRDAAAYALGGIGPDAKAAIPELIKQVRLGRLGGLTFHEPVMVVALGKIDLYAEGVLPALVGALKSKDADREAIGRVIESGGDKVVPLLLPVLKDSHPLVRYEAQGVLARIGPPALPALENALKGKDMALRLEAARTLQRMGPKAKPAVPALLEAFKDDNTDLRLTALWALQSIGPDARSAIPALSDALKGDDKRIRETICSTLGKVSADTKDATPALTRALQDKEASVRLAAARSLRSVDADTEEAIAGLIGAVADPAQPVRESAILSLGRLGPRARSAVPALTRALQDKGDTVRVQALNTLGAIGPEAKSAVPAIRDALTDKNASVRQCATRALKKIEGEEN